MDLRCTCSMSIALGELPGGLSVPLIACLAVPLCRLAVINLLAMTTGVAKAQPKLGLQRMSVTLTRQTGAH